MSEYKKIENAKAEVTCTLEGEKWQKAIDDAFRKLARKVEVKGFRKGQAPKNLAEKYINHNEVLLEAAEALAQETLNEAIDEHDITLIDRPELKLDDISDSKCVMTFACPVLPDVELGDYKKLEYKVEDVEVSDQDVDNDIADLLNRKADLELKEDGEVEDGDTTVIDFEGFLDGTAFEGGKSENYDLVIGSHSFIPGFEEQLIGMKAEETKDINVTFPEDYRADNLAGKDAKFTVTVHEIKKKVLPLLDDEFVKEQKIDDVNTVDEFREYTRNKLLKARKNDAESAADNKLSEDLAAITTVDIPEILIKNETDSMLNEYSQNMVAQGISLDQFLQITGQSLDDLRASLKDDAEKRIRVNLAIEEIAKKENVEISEDEIAEEYKKMSELYGMDVDQIRQYITDDNVKDDLRVQKTLEILKKQ